MIEILQEIVNKHAFSIYECSKTRKDQKLPIKKFWTDIDEEFYDPKTMGVNQAKSMTKMYESLIGIKIISPLNQEIIFGNLSDGGYNNYIQDVDIIDIYRQKGDEIRQE